MTHILNILQITFVFLISIPFTIIGVLVVPIPLLFGVVPFDAPNNIAHKPSFRLRKAFWLWGNADDGVDGDIWHVERTQLGV